MSAYAGWKWVPIEASREMLESMDKGDARQTWRNMLAAAPEPPADPRDAEIARLRDLLSECADDLEAEIVARSAGELPRRIQRDMETVKRARAALAPPEVPHG